MFNSPGQQQWLLAMEMSGMVSLSNFPTTTEIGSPGTPRPNDEGKAPVPSPQNTLAKSKKPGRPTI